MKTITFGIYKGKTVEQVIHINPRYVKWAEENISFFSLSSEEKLKLERELEKLEEHYITLKLMRTYGMHSCEALDFVEYDYPEYY